MIEALVFCLPRHCRPLASPIQHLDPLATAHSWDAASAKSGIAKTLLNHEAAEWVFTY